MMLGLIVKHSLNTSKQEAILSLVEPVDDKGIKRMIVPLQTLRELFVSTFTAEVVQEILLLDKLVVAPAKNFL